MYSCNSKAYIFDEDEAKVILTTHYWFHHTFYAININVCSVINTF